MRVPTVKRRLAPFFEQTVFEGQFSHDLLQPAESVS
jgi:hypothetical protein